SFLGGDSRGIDALHAVRALFHHAAAAHRDIRVAHQLQAGSLEIGEQQEVEATHFVRTVVGTVPCADAAVVDHVIQAFGGMHGRAHRTHRLAGSILALHAGHGLEEDLRTGSVAMVISVDADPLHLAATAYLVFADDREIVL